MPYQALIQLMFGDNAGTAFSAFPAPEKKERPKKGLSTTWGVTKSQPTRDLKATLKKVLEEQKAAQMATYAAEDAAAGEVGAGRGSERMLVEGEDCVFRRCGIQFHYCSSEIPCRTNGLVPAPSTPSIAASDWWHWLPPFCVNSSI